MDELGFHRDVNSLDSTEKFDASQYAFFGKDVVEEMELGGLEEDEEEVVFLGSRYSSIGTENEVRETGSVCYIDDIRSKFSKLTYVDDELGDAGVVGVKELLSEASWSGDVELKNWTDRPLLSNDSHLHKPNPSAPIHRTSSYPDDHLHHHHQQQYHHHDHHHQMHQQQSLLRSNPVAVPSPPPSFTSYPPPGHHQSHASPTRISPNPSLSPPHLHRPPHLFGQMMNQLPGPRPPHPLYPPPHLPHWRLSYPHSSMIRSKYMSAEEIDGIMRVQHAAALSSDPYVEDYYHQACMAARAKHHFFSPGSIRETTPHSRTSSEPHAFLQIDALGRVPFSSIRRPRPLLDVEKEFQNEKEKGRVPSLDQEPFLTARLVIEDGFLIILDVDDIDRLLHFTRPSDGGDLFRLRRQSLLHEMATSLHLLDHQDKAFLRIVSLPKGRKLISRFLRLLFPNSDISRLVSAAVFRHLASLFSIPDPSSLMLTEAVSSSIATMDLSSLGSCLAAVAASTEVPVLRPIGSGRGNEVSVLIKAVLERATDLLSSPQAMMSCNIASRAMWQASFDAFFGVLTSYCVGKYESIVVKGKAAEAAAAIRGEMPVELLRASLPHTDERQRRTLAEFAQRSTLPGRGENGHGS